MLVKVVEICWGVEAGMGGGMVVIWGFQPPVDEFYCGRGVGGWGRRREEGNGWMEGDFERRKKGKRTLT